MKYLAALLPFSAFADFANMEQQFQTKANVSQLTQLQGGFRSATNFGTGFTATLLSSFHEYGCWCYLDGQPVNGKSSPVNAIDAHCKALADGYACASMDETDACNAWEAAYTQFEIKRRQISQKDFSFGQLEFRWNRQSLSYLKSLF